MITQFESKIIELNFSFQFRPDNFYILIPINGVERTITVRLICSKPVNPLKYGSNNGNEIESIGLFKFQLISAEKESDFMIFAFQNSVKHKIEFIIIPTKELKLRLIKGHLATTDNHTFKIVFWLMDDRLYNCSDISLEGEWYNLSKGVNGRMADDTELDYTSFLNKWEILFKLKSSLPTID